MTRPRYCAILGPEEHPEPKVEIIAADPSETPGFFRVQTVCNRVFTVHESKIKKLGETS